MPPVNARELSASSSNAGRSGTITPEEYTSLKTMASRYGAKLLAQKVAKVCLKRSAWFKHENPNSMVGVAYASLASKISTALGTTTAKISRDSVDELFDMVDTYGAEVVVWKLAKIASRSSDTSTASTLNRIFGSAA